MKENKEEVLSAQTGNIVLSTETKFSEGYRIASSVNIGGTASSVRNANGDLEVYTVDQKGAVWQLRPDAASDTGYSSTILWESSIRSVVATHDAAGEVVIVAIDDNGVYVIYPDSFQQANASVRQSAVLPRSLESTDGFLKIFTATIGGKLYISLLYQYQANYAMMYCQWNDENSAFIHADVAFESLNCFWMGNSDDTVAFGCVSDKIMIYSFVHHTYSYCAVAKAFTCTDAAIALNAAGNNVIFAILQDGNLYTSGEITPITSSCSWSAMSQGMTINQVKATTDEQGLIHVFAVSANNRVYHWVSEAAVAGHYTSGAVIFSNTSAIDVTSNEDGIDIFAIGTAHNSLTHVYLENISGNWNFDPVELPGGKTVESYIAYSSDIIVSDSTGAILPNAAVSIWATEAATITVNGGTYMIDAKHPVKTSCNNAGMLSIHQETQSLAAPALKLTFPGQMPDTDSILLDQAGVVQQQLLTIKSADLMQAKDSDGNYLIGDQYRTPDATTSLATAVNQCMQLNTNPPPGCRPALLRGGKTKHGVWLYQGNDLRSTRKITAANDFHFHLSFANDRIQYKSLSSDEAVALLTAKRNTVRSANGWFDWVDDIGDFVRSVANGIANVVDAVVSAVSGAVKASITFIIDGVEYLFETAISYMEQVFDLVETIFAKLKVLFEKIWEWIGLLFNWGNILRTHEAIAYTINQYLGFVTGAMTGMQQLVSTGINNLQGSIHDVFENAINNIAGNSTIGAYAKSNEHQSDSFDSATSNNVVYNDFINNASGATFSMSATATIDTSPFDPFMQQVQSFFTNAQGLDSFKGLTDFYNKLGGSPDQLFNQLLADLLRVIEAFIDAVFSGLKALADGLFQLGQALFAVITQLLNQAWNIPFVSSFYSWLTDGAELTTIDLIALIAAIPLTFTYDTLYGKAPFDSEQDVANFKNAFTSQTMLQAAGYGPSVRKVNKSVAVQPLLSPDNAEFVALGNGMSCFFYGILTAINDAFPKDSPPIFSKVIFIFELAMQGFSFPWFYDWGGAPNCDSTDAKGMGRTLWLCQTVGVLIDAAFLKYGDRLPENTNDAGICIQGVYSIIHFELALKASMSLNAAGVAATILPVIPELGKFLRLDAVQVATEEGSVVVVAALDGLCYVATALILVATAKDAQP